MPFLLGNSKKYRQTALHFDEGVWVNLASHPHRPEHLKAAGVNLHDVTNLLNVLAGKIQMVEIAYLWRPQLRDPADEMVLEAAVNGQAGTIISFNQRDFLLQALHFGLVVSRPEQFFRGK